MGEHCRDQYTESEGEYYHTSVFIHHPWILPIESEPDSDSDEREHNRGDDCSGIHEFFYVTQS